LISLNIFAEIAPVAGFIFLFSAGTKRPFERDGSALDSIVHPCIELNRICP